MNKNGSFKIPKKWWQWVLMYPTLLLAIIGTMPTLYELYNSRKLDVPFGFSKTAIQQDEIWHKNFECIQQQKPKCVKTKFNVEVGAIVCPSGDVLLQVTSPDDSKIIRWVSLETFGLNKISTADFFPGEAFASDLHKKEKLAQAFTVLCQRWLNQGLLLRRVRYADGRCFDEQINTFTGAVISRAPAPCDSNC